MQTPNTKVFAEVQNCNLSAERQSFLSLLCYAALITNLSVKNLIQNFIYSLYVNQELAWTYFWCVTVTSLMIGCGVLANLSMFSFLLFSFSIQQQNNMGMTLGRLIQGFSPLWSHSVTIISSSSDLFHCPTCIIL